MPDPFSIPVRIISGPPGMSEFVKILLAAGVGATFGLIAGLVAEPLKRHFEHKHRVSKAAKLLYGSTRHEFDLLTSMYHRLDQMLNSLPPLPKDEHGNSSGPVAQKILDDDQYRIVGIEHMCSDFNTDIYGHYYGGDKDVYYDVPGANAITVFFEYIARLRLAGKPNSREDAKLMWIEMNRAIYGLLQAAETQIKDKTFYYSLEAIKDENMPPAVIGLADTSGMKPTARPRPIETQES